ncbi:MAG: hypothetical protein KGL39_50385 [Patescibacteria group bacterium]|nr:hypothetical protein [Patescibacteria group bacterium]
MSQYHAPDENHIPDEVPSCASPGCEHELSDEEVAGGIRYCWRCEMNPHRKGEHVTSLGLRSEKRN